MMDELYELLKQKLNNMRECEMETVSFNFTEVAKIYQFVCFMKQVKELVNWGEKK